MKRSFSFSSTCKLGSLILFTVISMQGCKEEDEQIPEEDPGVKICYEVLYELDDQGIGEADLKVITRAEIGGAGTPGAGEADYITDEHGKVCREASLRADTRVFLCQLEGAHPEYLPGVRNFNKSKIFPSPTVDPTHWPGNLFCEIVSCGIFKSTFQKHPGLWRG